MNRSHEQIYGLMLAFGIIAVALGGLLYAFDLIFGGAQ